MAVVAGPEPDRSVSPPKLAEAVEGPTPMAVAPIEHPPLAPAGVRGQRGRAAGGAHVDGHALRRRQALAVAGRRWP